MIFAPFTGKDNHGRCVTFAAGLLSKEDVDSYTWILKRFVECMKTKPTMIITDQDPALKIAVERVMPHTNHRFCMWHIMLKVADKIPVSLRENEGFAERFSDIVWSEYIDSADFDIKWNGILEEFGLLEHEWFTTMFALREFWIPAYFKDVSMAGLFRTTSMSESENSFFRRYNNKKANLLSFLMHFESAIDAQRNMHDKLTSTDESSFPIMRTDCLFEKHAAQVYTTNIFLKLQREMKSTGCYCSISKISRVCEKTSTYDIEDSFVNRVFRIHVNVEENSFDCECKNFLKHGLLCRHVFTVFKNLRMHKIPEKYIMTRWTKYACSVGEGSYKTDTSDSHNDIVAMLSKLHISSKRCIGVVQGDLDKMKALQQDLDELMVKYKKDGGNRSDASSKQQLFQTYYGCTIPDQVSVLPPDQVKTKGSGSRLKSRKEKALRDANKQPRRCNKCKKMGHHDVRNCHKFA